MQPFLSPHSRRPGSSCSRLSRSCTTSQRPATHGISIANMDPAVKPGDNFYLYANGGWLKRAVIPPDRSRISVFTTLSDLSNERTRTLIEDGAKPTHPRARIHRKSPTCITRIWMRPASSPVA